MMNSPSPNEKPENEKPDPFGHERGLHSGIENEEDPIGEFRNEGYGASQGWHQGGDYGGGQAANVGRSAGEVEVEDGGMTHAPVQGEDKTHENKQHQDGGADENAPGSQTTDQNQAPGSNTSSTSAGPGNNPEQEKKK